MGSISILDYLENKTIFITGSTGFLGKIFVEKVLRAQPGVKKLYLLVRSSDHKSAQERLQEEVLGTDLFRVLREEHGDGFADFVSRKLCCVAGDVARDAFGIDDPSLLELLWGEVDAVVNIAATTKFDERYDVALGINTLGSKRIVEFSKRCTKLNLLLHVSTAYVAGERSGIILEKPFRMGEALNGGPDVDIDYETELARKRVAALRSEGVTKKEERIAMKVFGLERARHFGWPNTYVFTKAMGEMIVGHAKESLPAAVAIMRPTIIASTCSDPFPGWIEGSRTIDSFITGYLKGAVSSVMGDPSLIVDVVPGDMAVNSMLGIMASLAARRADFIYHVGSSARNPVKYRSFEHACYRCFHIIGDELRSRHVQFRKIRWFTSKRQFHFYMRIVYKLPLEILRLANFAVFNIFRDKYTELSKKYNYMMRLADLYEPYTYFKGIFDERNLAKLRASLTQVDSEGNMFDFDTKNIDWDHYFGNIHVPGVVKYMDGATTF